MTFRPSLSPVLRVAPIAAVILVVLAGLVVAPDSVGARGGRYFSPYALALAPDGDLAYVSGRTANAIAVVDLRHGSVASEIGGVKEPTGLALSADGGTLFAASYGSRSVSAIDTKTGKTHGKIAVGASPSGLALSPDGDRLYVCNRMSNDVSVIDTQSRKELGRIPVVREPVHCAVTPDGSTLLVSNLLPVGRNDDPTLACDLSIIDTASMEVTGSVHFPTGCVELGEIGITPDGKWAYVVSVLARFLVPPTQIARGWINTNALTIIDIPNKAQYATVLLDELDRGAANPYGVAMAADGKTMYVSHTGCHEITQLDLEKLHQIIEETKPEERADLSRDLTFLYRNGVTHKFGTGGKGPMGVALSRDGRELCVANYYSDSLTEIKPSDEKVAASIALSDTEPDLERRGEILFHDADLCFQQWQSCASCHPDGRADGLRWDLLNDGLGNPKNAKSMMLAMQTPPAMSSGIRESGEVAAEAGIKYILFRQPEGDEVAAISTYLRNLQPEPSPYLTPDGRLSPAAKRGKALFEGERTGCAECHPAPLYTDMRMYDVGTRSEYDRRDDFDTPTLVELYRSGPYLHDGNAVTLREVLVDRNPDDKHGKVSPLSDQDIDDLVAFLLSL